jgi:hypothetical protein
MYRLMSVGECFGRAASAAAAAVARVVREGSAGNFKLDLRALGVFVEVATVSDGEILHICIG